MSYEIGSGNNVRLLRQSKNLSMRELAERMGVHFTTIAKIERSQRKLTPEWVERFAKALEMQPGQVMPTESTLNRINTQARRIPVIGMVSAGTWRDAIQETEDTVPAPVDEPNAFGLRVDGDSMDKIIPSGGVVIVDPDQIEMHDGSLYVLMNGEGETTFKRYRANPGRLEPLSTNPVHTALQLGEPFTVVGRVIGAYRPL